MSDESRAPLSVTAARGVGILVSRTLVLQLLTAGVTLVLARLLTPADYGLFALAIAVQSLAQVASGVGLGAALIRQPEDPSAHEQRAVTGFLFSTGIAFAAATALLAFALLPALELESDALQVIAVTGMTVPIYALRTVPMALLERHLHFGRVAVVETVETLSFNASALAGALAGLGAYSLAGAVPVAAASGLLAARQLQRPGPGIGLDFGAIRPLAHFGLRASGLQTITLARGLVFVSLIAAIGGTALAGFYGMASRLFAVPTALASAVQRVSFPALSRSAEERPRRAARAATLSAALASLALALLAGCSHTLVAVLLGDRWLPTVELILTSSPGVLLAASSIPAMVALALAQGRPGVPIAAVAGSAITMVGVGLAAVPELGAAGVGMAMTAGAGVNAAMLARRAEREMQSAASSVAKALTIGVVAAALGYLAPLPETWLGLAIRILLVASVWASLGLWIMRAALLDALRLVRPLIPSRPRGSQRLAGSVACSLATVRHPPRPSPMNYERLYAYRFRDIDQAARLRVWEEIAPHVHGLMGSPQTVLDPAAGRGEFICSIPAAERWAVDEVAYPEAERAEGVKVVTSRIMDAELPSEHFDGVFASNFLEHLHDQEAIAAFLERMHGAMKTGGRIAIMGPNYRYCAKEYWDCADHYVALTHVAIAEHLYAAGFEPERIVPRYLPYSFRGILPPSPRLTGLYLRAPLAWKLLGKQFLVIGRR